LEMDRNILLYLTESAKELPPRYIKTSKGLILPREIVGKRGNIQGKRTDNTIRIPKARLTEDQDLSINPLPQKRGPEEVYRVGRRCPYF
jgi:hypothetical protein